MKKSLLTSVRNTLLFFLIIISTYHVGLAQVHEQENDLRTVNSINSQTKLPGSPEASSLGEYGNFDVNKYTGTANISIPIYAISGNRIGLSVNANYATGGIKVEERGSGSLGVGWALNAGGSISRAVKGAPDMHYNYYDSSHVFVDYLSEPTTPNFDIYDFYYRDVNGAVETQPDAYFYSFNGRTGKFHISADKDILIVDDNDLDIVPTFSTVFKQIAPFTEIAILSKFVITDEYGTKYTFEDAEYTTMQYDDDQSLPARAYNNHEYHNAWHLTKIESHDGVEQISFTYDEASINYNPPVNVEQYKSRTFRVGVNVTEGSCSMLEDEDGTPIEAGLDFINITNRKFLNSITYQLGTSLIEKLEFELSENECAHAIDTDQQLNDIKIYKGENAQYHQLTHHFDYTCMDGRLFLTDTGIRTATESTYATKPPYTFEYHTEALPSPISNAQDKWGFFNGQTNNTTLIPNSSVPEITWPNGANRSSNPDKAIARILTKITYPTKGYTNYAYEGNTITNSNVIFTLEGCSFPCPFFESCQADLSDCGAAQCVEPTENEYPSVSFPAELVNSGYFLIRSDSICGSGQIPRAVQNVWLGGATISIYDNNTGNSVGQYNKMFNETPFRDTVKISSLFNVVAGNSYRVVISGSSTRTTANIKIGTFSSLNRNTDIGGLRIQSIKHYDRDNTFLKGKAYSYNNISGERSSGIVVTNPRFEEVGSYLYEAPIMLGGCNGCCGYNYTTVRLTAAPSFPLGSYDGSFYGYSRVEEMDLLTADESQTEGKIVCHYYNETKSGSTVDVVKNGKLRQKEYIDQNGKLVKNESYLYAFDVGENQRQQIFSGFKIGAISQQNNKRFLVKLNSGGFVWTQETGDLIDENSRKTYNSRWTRNSTDYMNVVNYSTFLTSVTTSYSYYDNMGQFTGSVSETISHDYSTNLNTVQPSSTVRINSNGDEHRMEYKYPDSYTSGTIKTALEDRNIILPAWETTHYYNDDLIDGVSTDYGFFSSLTGAFLNDESSSPHLYPYTVDNYEVTWLAPLAGNIIGNLSTGTWDTQITASEYSVVTGKPTKTKRRHWAFDDEYTYDDAGNVTKHKFGTYEQNFVYEQETYLLQKMINIDGTSESYQYDDLLRTLSVKDDNRNVEVLMDYNYGSTYNDISKTTKYSSLGRNAIDLVDIDYFDGLGRHIQTRKKSQGPTASESMVMGQTYDPIGRVHFQYEPKAVADGNAPINLSGPRTETIYDGSPLNRTIKVISPETWMTSRTEYGTNSSNEVEGYTANELFKVTLFDGNENQIDRFTDKRGNTVLTRAHNEDEMGNAILHNTQNFYDGRDRKVLVLPPGTDINDTDLTFRNLYNKTGTLESEYIPGKGLIQYRHDLRGNQIYKRDPLQASKNRWRASSYDDYGNIDQQGWNNTAGVLADDDVAQAVFIDIKIDYNFGSSGISTGKMVLSKVEEINNSAIEYQCHFTYDTAGRLSKKEFNHPLSMVDKSLKEHYYYDAADNTIKTVFDYTDISASPIEFNLSHVIDHAGRVSENWYGQGESGQKKLCEYTFTEKNQIESMILGNHLQTVDYTYLDNQMLHTINGTSLSGGDLYQQELFYNTPHTTFNGVTGQLNGNISSWRWKASGDILTNTYNYKYDKLNRLTHAFGGNSTLSRYSTEYKYDLRGNMSYLKRRNQSAIIDELNYTLGSGNRVSSIDDVTNNSLGYNGTTSRNYIYDLNGNVIEDESRDVVSKYNHLNLGDEHKMGDDDNYIKYIYDEEGKLLTKREHEGGNTIKTDYIGPVEYENGMINRIHHGHGYFGLSSSPNSNLTLTGIQSVDVDECGPVITSTEDIQSNTLVNYFATQQICLDPGFEVILGAYFLADFKPYGKEDFHWVIKDHLSNVRVTFDDDGTLEQSLSYYAYGALWDTSNNTNDYDWKSGTVEREDAFDLKYERHPFRVRDPIANVWLGVDALSSSMPFWGGYSSMGNNPVSMSDPLGLSPSTSIDGSDISAEKSDERETRAAEREEEESNEKGETEVKCCATSGLASGLETQQTLKYQKTYNNLSPEEQKAQDKRTKSYLIFVGVSSLPLGRIFKWGRGLFKAKAVKEVVNLVKISTISDDVIVFSSRFGDEIVEGISNFKVIGDKLHLNGLHLQGSAAGEIGRAKLWNMARDLGSQFNVKEVIIQGGKRTTGKYKGTVPSPINIKVNKI